MRVASNSISILFIVVFTALFVFTPTRTFSQNSMGKTAISFQPLGFLQFGPIVKGEFALAPNTFAGAHFRYSALGLLYHAIESDGFEDEVSFGSLAFGGGIWHFLARESSPHRFYFGGIVEYSEAGQEDLSAILMNGRARILPWDLLPMQVIAGVFHPDSF